MGERIRNAARNIASRVRNVFSRNRTPSGAGRSSGS